MSQRLRLLISGGVLAVLFAMVLILMLPNPWAILAALAVGGAGAWGAYGITAGRSLPAPSERVSLPRPEQARMRQALDALDSRIRSRAAQLPPSTQGQLRMTVVGLQEVVERWSVLDGLPEHQEAVRRMAESHLPRTVDLFLKLPDSAKPEHAAEFKSQVGIIAEAVAKTRDTVVGRNLHELRAHGWLLEESLADRDVRLFREHGL